ncbi:hypothetical protein D9613_006982 [Agrocybe pediades]|uniref:F-box domain-containing protein n=1 Tax=Agrocybe pediades TaxID=84607 RepID=A0A8H4QIT0_9AGAR|nr:hypothetical protein D9613_006982 [Agrocybe pediades]
MRLYDFTVKPLGCFCQDDNVDRAYRREEMIKSILREQQEGLNTKPTTEVDQLAESFKEAVVIKPASKKTGPSMMTGTLAKLVQEFVSAPLAFEPEIENQPVLLNMLPEELIVLILSELDPTSVERFARVCKKARVLSLDPTIWRKHVHRTYQPPQILDFDALSTVIERFLWDFRRVYIEQPRVRLDGIYIATCLYIRAGTSENSWVNSSHLITYHRYLRFFPNGQVLSLLANEEHTPQQVIPMLKPSLRMNGLHIGQWKLEGSTVHLTNLIDASGRYILPTSVDTEDPSHLGSPTPNNGEHPRYVFLMTLELKSRPLGRWNKMDILAYESLNLGSGEVDPFMLKNERPFWFSKVRSYGTG